MANIKASVQYNDFKGTVAADRSDELSFAKYLEEEGLLKGDERVVGFRIGFIENHGQEMDNTGVVVYLQAGTYDEPAETIRAIDVPMNTAEFFSFFKRFALVATQDGMEIDEANIDGPHYD